MLTKIRNLTTRSIRRMERKLSSGKLPLLLLALSRNGRNSITESLNLDHPISDHHQNLTACCQSRVPPPYQKFHQNLPITFRDIWHRHADEQTRHSKNITTADLGGGKTWKLVTANRSRVSIRGRPCTIFLASNLITLRIPKSPKFGGRWGLAYFGWRRGWPIETRFSPTCVIKFRPPSQTV